MTTRTLRQCRKAYRHVISDALRMERGERISAVKIRHRRQYLESFPIQVCKSVNAWEVRV
jgi:hypothetical protein